MLFAFIEVPNALPTEENGEKLQLVTDNPLLARHLADYAVLNLDGLIGQQRANELGRVALDLANLVDHKLRDSDSSSICGIPSDEIRLAGVTSRLVSGLLHRSEALRLGIEQAKPDRVLLQVTEQPRFEPSQPLLPPRFASPARALAECGFFEPLAVSIETVDFVPPSAVNETASSDQPSKGMILPPKVVRRELLNRLLRKRSNGQNRKILVGGLNEVVRETLPELEGRGFDIENTGKLMVGPPASKVFYSETLTIDPQLRNLIGATLNEELSNHLDFSDQQRAAVVEVLIQHLSAGLQNMARRREFIIQRVSELGRSTNGFKPILLTNGMFGPYGALAYAAAKRNDFLVIDAEHGVTTGLAALSDAKIDYSEASTSDILLCSSERAASAFSQCSREAPPKIHVVGLADQTRTLFRPRFQRIWSRRRLGVQGHGKVIMHVSTLPYYGNLRPGLSAPSETTTCELECAFVEEVYNRVKATVLYKPYPTQRFPFEPELGKVVKAAENVHILPDEDFRYIRAAADVVVSLTPTSTLGWCVGLNYPFVWLHTERFNCLASKELSKSFADAFLFVDMDKPSWQSDLRELLGHPLAELQRMWKSRSAARSRLLENDICGPAGVVGVKAAEVIADIANSHS